MFTGYKANRFSLSNELKHFMDGDLSKQHGVPLEQHIPFLVLLT